MPQQSKLVSRGQASAREENWFEYMITHHRWVFCIFLLMPLSLMFGECAKKGISRKLPREVSFYLRTDLF